MSQAYQSCLQCGQTASLDAASCPRCGSALQPDRIPPGGNPIMQNSYMMNTAL